MEVILLEKVGKLGNLGDKVAVKSGYGRNYLIPYGKAVSATEQNLADFETRRAELEKAAAEAKASADSRSQGLEGKEIVITAKAGEEGKLFGSVGTKDIADAVSAAGNLVEKREVRMPEGPIRQVGMYDINIQLHTDVMVAVKIIVEAE
ncbi:MAG: 50S ribosomal protein L9 [Pseudomonadales bacterium]|nr:50S ribosomal protein L9 [Pseudomonadales bacterium]MCP5216488.1 50S ribosomal protein L9 [Pseudomonadales bacterium]